MQHRKTCGKSVEFFVYCVVFRKYTFSIYPRTCGGLSYSLFWKSEIRNLYTICVFPMCSTYLLCCTFLNQNVNNFRHQVSILKVCFMSFHFLGTSSLFKSKYSSLRPEFLFFSQMTPSLIPVCNKESELKLLFLQEPKICVSCCSPTLASAHLTCTNGSLKATTHI